MKSFIFILSVLFFAASGFAKTDGEKEAGMKISSPAFENNKFMPERFGYRQDNVSPPLVIENIPAGAKSLVLIVDDPDAPMGTWIHWLCYDMAVAGEIKEGALQGKQGLNDFGNNRYDGPCPPSGIHRYFFRIYALRGVLGLGEGATRKELEDAMKGRILGEAELVGLYKSER